MIVTIGLTGLLCFGCGNNASTNESTPAVSNDTPEETDNQEEVEPTEESEEVDTEKVVDTEEEAETPVETEKVYLLKDRISYDSDGNITMEIHNEYNDAGEKIKSIIDGETITYSYEYNNDNILIKEEALKEDGSIYYTIEYDNDGNEIRHYSCVYTGNYIEDNYTYKSGVKSTCTTILYDENGDISAEYNYVYDEFGNETSEEIKMCFDEEIGTISYIEKYSYEYNSDNLPIKKTKESNADTDMGESIEEFEYNSNGNVIKEKVTSYNSDGTIDYTSLKEYEYDNQNNMIKDVYHVDDELSYHVETEIIYDENR